MRLCTESRLQVCLRSLHHRSLVHLLAHGRPLPSQKVVCTDRRWSGSAGHKLDPARQPPWTGWESEARKQKSR